MKNIKKFNEMSAMISDKVTDHMTRRWISDKAFKLLHIKNIGIILKRVYEPKGHWKRRNGTSGFFGVMDLPWDSERWSLLNRINTNYSALSILINSTNDVLTKGNSDIPRFDFIQNPFGSATFYTEYNRMMDFVHRNSNNIFLKLTEDDGSTIINNIIKAIDRSKRIGDKAETVVSQYLPLVRSGITNIKLPEGSGDSNDMIGGADIFFDYKGKTYTIQVKKVSRIKKEPYYTTKTYTTVGASISKHYKTDYYAVLDNKFLIFFRNDPSNIKLIDGELTFNRSVLVKEFEYKN